MLLDKNNTSFGRHESFALRYGWITKGYIAYINDSEIFKKDEATVELGVGRNMVHAIRYWLNACQIIDEESGNPTEIGEMLFDQKNGLDPYLEDEATIWLLHWLLASNPTKATAIFWFFNKFHKAEFSSQEVQTALSDFVKDQIETKTSASTVKGDAQLVLRMYSPSRAVGKIPVEEALDSPLSLLRLVVHGSSKKNHVSKPEERKQLPLGVLGYSVLELLKIKRMTSLPIEDLMYAKDHYAAPGAIFRMTENDLITRLEQLVNYIPNKLAIRETAGIHQLYLLDENVDSLSYLQKHYEDSIKGIAA